MQETMNGAQHKIYMENTSNEGKKTMEHYQRSLLINF